MAEFRSSSGGARRKAGLAPVSRRSYAIDTKSYSDPNLRKIIENGTAEMCRQIAQHPAVIGFIIGNELNGPDQIQSPSWWEQMDQLGSIVKESQDGRDKLTMQCFYDDGMNTPRLAMSVGKGMPSIDGFGINSYRGTKAIGFDTLFADYAAACPKPLLISEFGCPASTHVPDAPYPTGQCVELPDNAAAQAEYVVTHWNDIVAHRDVCSGGYVFEWCDEWWKQRPFPVDEHSGSPGKADPFPGGWWDDEWFGILLCRGERASRERPQPRPSGRAHPAGGL